MSAEILRRAAALMRERAEAARAGRWFADGPDILAQWEHEARYIGTCDAVPSPDGNVLNADHIASWHPLVALAVADWLESTANDVEHVHTPVYNLTSTTVARALTVANAYLGEQA